MMLADKIMDFHGKNFAYFCKFDDDGINGNEELFISSREPVMIYNGAIGHLNNQFQDILKNGTIPMIVSYDFIDDIYPDIGIKRSSWPEIAYIIPEMSFSSTFTRSRVKTDASNNSKSDAQLESNISEIIDKIKKGDLLQLVISKRFDIENYDIMALLKKFLLFDRSLYVYYYKFGDMEVVGSSPENLFTVSHGKITIYPVAGTRKRGKTVDEDLKLEEELKNDEKELLEHRMLVDLARNDAGKICIPGTVNVAKSMYIAKFASVQHIVSSVTGNVNNERHGDILKAIFPAGTVSGAPKKRAITLINSYENMPRGPYAGAIGIINGKDIDMALLIRSLYRNADESYTQAGAGIVKNSIPANEVNEIYSKVLTATGGLYEKNIDY
ncbi:MAG: chorismate-binding protein [Ferroplasma sp.]